MPIISGHGLTAIGFYGIFKLLEMFIELLSAPKCVLHHVHVWMNLCFEEECRTLYILFTFQCVCFRAKWLLMTGGFHLIDTLRFSFASPFAAYQTFSTEKPHTHRNYRLVIFLSYIRLPCSQIMENIREVGSHFNENAFHVNSMPMVDDLFSRNEKACSDLDCIHSSSGSL